MATITKVATLAPIPTPAAAGTGISGTMTFKQTVTGNKTKMVITGTASGFLSPTTVYVSLVYGKDSVPTGATPCRDDGTLGGVVLDPQDVLAVGDLLKNVKIKVGLVNLPLGDVLASKINPVLVPALQTGLGPLSSVNMPPPGGILFSPKATLRMFLGVWGFANPQGQSTFGPVTREWTGPNDPLAIPFEKINTVSIRQPQFPLLPNPVSDARPQIFQLRACGQLV